MKRIRRFIDQHHVRGLSAQDWPEHRRLRLLSSYRWAFYVEWKPQDLWIGAFWKSSWCITDVWLTLIPTLPLHIVYTPLVGPNNTEY